MCGIVLSRSDAHEVDRRWRGISVTTDDVVTNMVSLSTRDDVIGPRDPEPSELTWRQQIRHLPRLQHCTVVALPAAWTALGAVLTAPKHQCWGIFKYYLYLNIKLGKKYLS